MCRESCDQKYIVEKLAEAQSADSWTPVRARTYGQYTIHLNPLKYDDNSTGRRLVERLLKLTVPEADTPLHYEWEIVEHHCVLQKNCVHLSTPTLIGNTAESQACRITSWPNHKLALSWYSFP